MSFNRQIADELERIEEDATHSSKTQFNAASRWARIHYWIGIPAALTAAIAGATALSDYATVAGCLALISACLSALQTFLKPSERSGAHKGAGDQYLALKNDVRVFRTVRLIDIDDEAAKASLEELSQRRNSLNRISPQCSQRDRLKARKGIEAGEATHAIDRAR